MLSTAAPGWNFASYAGAPRGAEGCPCSAVYIPCNDSQRTTSNMCIVGILIGLQKPLCNFIGFRFFCEELLEVSEKSHGNVRVNSVKRRGWEPPDSMRRACGCGDPGAMANSHDGGKNQR